MARRLEGGLLSHWGRLSEVANFADETDYNYLAGAVNLKEVPDNNAKHVGAYALRCCQQGSVLPNFAGWKGRVCEASGPVKVCYGCQNDLAGARDVQHARDEACVTHRSCGSLHTPYE
jgi:hypothetical protein